LRGADKIAAETVRLVARRSIILEAGAVAMPRNARYNPLFEPIQIGSKTLKNRFFQVPQCTGAGFRYPGANAAHRAVKAEGGWAALCTEACSIHPETSHSKVTVAAIWDEGDVINHRHMVDSVHRWDALAGIELLYGGGFTDNFGTRYVQTAMHQMQSASVPHSYTFEAEEEDLARIQTMYVEAAKRAVAAGFDIVYVHGSAGAFPVQTLSRHFNRRTDKYGGSFENRARFWLELLEAIRRAVGDHCAIANRFSVDQLSGDSGVQLEEEGLAFIDIVTRNGLVDLWDVNLGGLQEWGEDAGPSRFYKINHQAAWTRSVKSVTKVPVVGVGRFTDPDEMLRVIRSGQYDIIGCARPSIADPWLPRKIDEDRIDDICECIGCNLCISRFERGATIVCTQNPTALEEYRRNWHPEKFNPAQSGDDLVVVVGAGPAGLECARVLGARGYKTHLLEAKAELGGHLRDVTRLPGLAEWSRVYTWRETQIKKMPNVEILRGVGFVEAEHLLAYGASRIVVATGARWVGNGIAGFGPEPIAGVDSGATGIVTPEQYWAGKPIGQRVVILDGDGYFMAVSLAEKLADAGKTVTLVTWCEKVAPYADFTLEGPNLRRMMRDKGIFERVAHWVERVECHNSVQLQIFDIYRDGYQRSSGPDTGKMPRRQGTITERLDCDTLLLCTSRRSNDGLYQAMKRHQHSWRDNGISGVFRAGDCLAPRYLADAIFDGHRIGREFESANPERPRSIIRERQIWGQPVIPPAGEAVL
jgi:dimethylamine/trimethylamine dehydrogenase